MRRLIVTLVVLAGMLVAATPAQARWGCGWGWRGCGVGWGGCGWGWRGCGWGGWGWNSHCFAGPAFYYPAYNYPLVNFTCGTTIGTPVGLGYSVYQPSYYSANGRFASTTLPQPRFSVSAGGVTAQELERFLALRGEVTPVLGVLSDRLLPKMSARVSNAQTRQRAMRLLAEGDALFQAQNFNSALQRYKLASSLAPDVEEAFWRQGHAFVATKNFGQATTAFKRAIALTDNLGRGGFRLDDLYGGASMTKATDLENLAELALNHSGDSDAYFLIGVFLNYDGQADRAIRFFDRASDLAGISGGHIEVFLDRAAAPVIAARPAAPPVPPSPPAEVFIATGTEI
jgi:hypothetical protein